MTAHQYEEQWQWPIGDDAVPIAAVEHGLGTMDVIVTTYAGEEPIGYLFAQPVTRDEVEVAIMPGTTRIGVDPTSPRPT